MVRQAAVSNAEEIEAALDSPESKSKKPRRQTGPRQMVAIVTVDEQGKVNLEAASYDAAALLSKFGELSRNGVNPQILNIVRS